MHTLILMYCRLSIYYAFVSGVYCTSGFSIRNFFTCIFAMVIFETVICMRNVNDVMVKPQQCESIIFIFDTEQRIDDTFFAVHLLKYFSMSHIQRWRNSTACEICMKSAKGQSYDMRIGGEFTLRMLFAVSYKRW